MKALRLSDSALPLTMLFCAMILTACGDGGGNRVFLPAPIDADLSNLTVENAPLTPAFGRNVTIYAAVVGSTVTTTRVAATKSDSQATVTVNGNSVTSGMPSDAIGLLIGNNRITVVVTGSDGSTRKTYTVDVFRPNNNANLSDLVLSTTTLDQLFDPSITSYDASQGFFGTFTRLIATPEDPNASMEAGGETIEAGEPSARQLLTEGANSLSVIVTAEDAAATRTYSVALTRQSIGTLQSESYIKASNTFGGDRFGASLSIDEDTLAIGALHERSNATGIDGDQTNNSLVSAGAVYLFDRIGTTWAQDAYIKASNTNSGDLFGAALGVFDAELAVTAPSEQSLTGDPADNSGSSVGAVYVFARDLGLWSQTDYLKASNADSSDAFGTSLALSEDHLLIGAPFEESDAIGVDGDQLNNNLTRAGAAYLYRRDTSGAWIQDTYLKASDTRANDQFANAVALGTDAMAIGAWLEDSGSTGIDGIQDDSSEVDSGAVYVFDLEATPAQTAYVKASNTNGGDHFGAALAIDDDLLVVGASGEDGDSPGIDGLDNNDMQDAGAVYVFNQDATGAWAQEAYIKASNPGPADRFGASISLKGNLLVVGAPGERSSATGINGIQVDESMLNAGAVYVFERSETGIWSQIAYTKASNTDAGDSFGFSVVSDGDTVVSGAPGEQSTSTGINGIEVNNDLTDAGAVYVIR